MAHVENETFLKVFVTVGTTDFDSLVTELDCEEFVELIKCKGCIQLVVQYGRGAHIPHYLSESCPRNGITFESFRFKDSLESFMKDATLVISHAGNGPASCSVSTHLRPCTPAATGAGSITEALSLNKALMVCPPFPHPLRATCALVRLCL